jgi:hypothetical protein
MKKLLLTSLILLGIFSGIFLSSGSTAFAWHHGFGPFGIFIAPPPLWVGPPAVYYRGYYPPYYGPGYYSGPDYYNGSSRYWVPGHWERRWTPYGWQRVWAPGYWQY